MVGLQEMKGREPSSLFYGTELQEEGPWVKLLDSGSVDAQLIPEEGKSDGRKFPLTNRVSQRWLCYTL